MGSMTQQEILHEALVIAARNTAEEVETRETAALEDGGDSIDELIGTENLRGYIEGLDHALSIVRELWPSLAPEGIPLSHPSED